MTTTGVTAMHSREHDENEGGEEEEEDPMPIELPGLDMLDDDKGCCSSCWNVFSSVISLVLYTIEYFVAIWVSYTYASNHMYVPFGLSLGYLALPHVILVTISLTWYYNLDRFHRKRKDSDPHNLEFLEYRKKFSPAAVIFHILLLGMVYRYAQVVYLVMIRKRDNLPYLRRDTTYLRLIHSFLVSAPLIVVYLYTLFSHLPNCLMPTDQCLITSYPAVWVGLGASLLSFFYSILAFTTNDRLSGKRRRVILPGHITQTLWYVCMLASRIIAIVLFANAYEYYIFPFIGGHWIVMFVFLLIQRTTFCSDVIRENPTEVRIKRRWCLEIPFLFVAATMYVFTYVNLRRRGKTRYWMLFFHLIMYAEIAAMSALFYIKSMGEQFYVFSLTVLTLTLGLYPVGVLFMLTYYLFFHPRKTDGWYWVGIPKRGDGSRNNRQDIVGRGFRNRASNDSGRVVISGPTLVAHNGFIPQSMLPDGIPTSPTDNMATDPAMIISQARRDANEQGEHGNRLVPDWVTPRTSGTVTHRDMVTSLTMVSPNSTGNTAILPTTTPSESLPALSDLQSQTGPSDMETDHESESRASPQLSGGDNVIDTPLFGTTPDPAQQSRIMEQHSTGEPTSLGTIRSRTDTEDTGIDLEADNGDHDLHGDYGASTEYNPLKRSGGSSIEHGGMSMNIDLQQFKDIPAKKQGYLRKKGPLESHYFPEKNGKQSRESLTPTLPTPTWGQTPPYHSPSSTRAMLGQNSSGESGELYHPKVRSTMFSNHDQQHHVLPLAISTPERTRRSNAPRSPKGARAFTIIPDSDGKSQTLVKNPINHSSSYPGQPAQGTPMETQPHHSPQRLRAPRSPKGAKRMLIVQPDSSGPNKTAPGARASIEQYPNMNSSIYPTAPQYNLPISARSPERLPKGVSNYQRQSSGSFKGLASVKVPHNNLRMQKSYSPHVQNAALRSPEQQQKGVRSYKREGPNIQQRQYIQQQQQNRSRWDKWAAEQEEKRRQANSTTGDSSSVGLQRKHSFTSSYGSGAAKSSQSSYSPKHRAEKTQSYPVQPNRLSGTEQLSLKSQFSEEFDHLSPISATLDSYPSQHENLTDGSSSFPEGASVAPQAYPRAPQGARGNGPKMAWSPSRKDRITTSPQRSVHSMVGASLLQKESIDMGPLSSSCRIPRVPVAGGRGQSDYSQAKPRPLRMFQNHERNSGSILYVPTHSTHQSVV